MFPIIRELGLSHNLNFMHVWIGTEPSNPVCEKGLMELHPGSAAFVIDRGVTSSIPGLKEKDFAHGSRRFVERRTFERAHSRADAARSEHTLANLNLIRSELSR